MTDQSDTASEVRFTLEIDRRILRGYLGDRPEMMRELKREGFTEKAIVARAASLGVSSSSIAKVDADKLTIQRCLSCDSAFVSYGRQNRLCSKCRHRR